MSRKITMFSPFISSSAKERVSKVLSGRWVGQGPLVDAFENAFCEKFGLKYVASLNSGTSALRLAMAICGVGPGDEVITPAFTSFATNMPILEQYARPVFADVQYDTGDLDPNDVGGRITRKTKAIIAVDWAGYPCDLDELKKIARDNGVPLIEDAAHAIGATYKGKPVGRICRFTAYSLQATKQLTVGDGGMLATTSREDFDAVIRRRWYGLDKRKRRVSELGIDPRLDIREPGYKYNMTDVDAAIGLGQLDYFDEMARRRREVVKAYREGLEGIDGLSLFADSKDRTSANYLFCLHAQRRMDFARMMHSKGIEVSAIHERNDRYSVFGGLRRDLPNTEKMNNTIVCLPLHNALSDDDVSFIINSVKRGW